MKPITLDNPDLLDLLDAMEAAGKLRVDTNGVPMYCTTMLLEAIGEELFVGGGVDALAVLRRLHPDHPVRQQWVRQHQAEAEAGRELATMYELAIKNLESLPSE